MTDPDPDEPPSHAQQTLDLAGPYACLLQEQLVDIAIVVTEGRRIVLRLELTTTAAQLVVLALQRAPDVVQLGEDRLVVYARHLLVPCERQKLPNKSMRVKDFGVSRSARSEYRHIVSRNMRF
jgi:hypothetical protein